MIKLRDTWLWVLSSIGVTGLLLGLLWLALGSHAALQAQDLQCQQSASSIPAGPIMINIKEGTTGTYKMRLCQEPTEPVMIKVETNIAGELNLQPSMLVFTQANFNITQAINVGAVDDNISQGDRQVELTHTVETTDPLYAIEQVSQILVTIFDNEGTCDGKTTSILAEPSQLEVEEGESQFYRLRLCKQPTAPVIITVVTDTTSIVTIDPSTLVFTPENYNDPQSVRITAIEDDFVQATRFLALLHKVTATTDPAYQDERGAAVVVTIINNDVICSDTTPIISVQPAELQILEGTTQTYQLNWCQQLAQHVTITISATQPDAIAVTPSEITFLPDSQLVTHTVVVSALNDSLYNANRLVTLTHAITSTDPNLPTLATSPVVKVTIQEDEEGVLLPVIAFSPTIKPLTPPTWAPVSNNGQFVDVVKVYQNTLFTGHRQSGGAGGGIYKGSTQCRADTRVSAEFSTRDMVFKNNNGVVATFNERAYYSTNNGDSWSPTKTSSMNRFVYAVEYSNATNTVYAGTDNGLYVSTNNGVDWGHVDPTSASSPKFIYSLYFDSAANRLWIGSYQEGVWQVALDKPTVFTKINDGLPGNNVKALEIWEIVADGADFYIATSDGVYKRAGSGAWQAYGLQGAQVFSLEIVKDQTSSWLYAGLNAGGVQRTVIASSPVWSSISSPALATKTVRDLFNDTSALCGGLLAATEDGVWLYR